MVYNKIDQAIGSKDHLAEYNYLEEEFDKVISVSAIKEKNIKGLINLIFELLPEKDSKLTEEDVEIMEAKGKPIISLNSKEYIAEIIREKAYLFLRKEVPYSVNVEVDDVIDKKKLILIKARILTTADRYKKMIIGRGGKKIKEIGLEAFTKKYDPYWDIPLNENLPKPVIELSLPKAESGQINLFGEVETPRKGRRRKRA